MKIQFPAYCGIQTHAQIWEWLLSANAESPWSNVCVQSLPSVTSYSIPMTFCSHKVPPGFVWVLWLHLMATPPPENTQHNKKMATGATMLTMSSIILYRISREIYSGLALCYVSMWLSTNQFIPALLKLLHWHSSFASVHWNSPV